MMALISIIAKGKHDIEWQKIYSITRSANVNGIEVFPIPVELGFEQGAIGIAALSNYDDKEEILVGVTKLVELLYANGFDLIELYSGSNIDATNGRDIIFSLL